MNHKQQAIKSDSDMVSADTDTDSNNTADTATDSRTKANAATGNDTQNADADNTAPASRQQVIDYLRRHRDFFLEQDDLLMELSLPHPSGKAVSLLERQVTLLRDRSRDAQHKLSSLLINARNNDQLFAITGDLVLALLQAEDAAAVVATTKGLLGDQPNIDACEIILADTLAVEAAPDTANTSPASGTTPPPLRLMSEAEMKKEYAEVFRLNRAHCGPLDAERLARLFPTAPDIRSTALCPITGEAPALIALGSIEADYFNIHLDTLFLDFIGRLIGAVLERQTR